MRRKTLAFGYALALVLLLLHGWSMPRRQAADITPVATGQPRPDRHMFAAVVHRLQRGEHYYNAMGAELRAGGYPTASVFNWRTPLHLSLLSVITIGGARLVLAGLAVLALVLLRPFSPSPQALLIVVGVPLLASTILIELPEVWAGTLIALSIGAYVRHKWVLAAICGVLAVFVRELAVVYAVVAGTLALLSRRRSESLAWLAGGAMYLAYFSWHVQKVTAAMPPDAQAHGASWVQFGGLRFVYRTLECYGWTLPAPSILAPLVLVCGLLGILSKTMPIQARASLIGYLGAFAAVGLPINRNWGFVTVSLWGLGILHAWTGLQRLRCWLFERTSKASSAPKVGKPEGRTDSDHAS